MHAKLKTSTWIVTCGFVLANESQTLILMSYQFTFLLTLHVVAMHDDPQAHHSKPVVFLSSWRSLKAALCAKWDKRMSN